MTIVCSDPKYDADATILQLTQESAVWPDLHPITFDFVVSTAFLTNQVPSTRKMIVFLYDTTTNKLVVLQQNASFRILELGVTPRILS